MDPTPPRCAGRCCCSLPRGSGPPGTSFWRLGPLLQTCVAPSATATPERAGAGTEGGSVRNVLLSLLAIASAASYAGADGIKVLNDDAHFAEGPIWYHGKLYYVEYDRNSVTAWDGARNAIFWSKQGCGPSAVLPTAPGEFPPPW